MILVMSAICLASEETDDAGSVSLGLLRAEHSETDPASSVSSLAKQIADITQIIRDRGYQVMAQVAVHFSGSLTPQQVLHIACTMDFLDSVYPETAEIKTTRLNNIRAFGLASVLQCRASLSMPLQSVAYQHMIRDTDRAVAPRERDVASYMEHSVTPDFWAPMSQQIEGMQRAFYLDELAFAEARNKWQQLVEQARNM